MKECEKELTTQLKYSIYKTQQQEEKAVTEKKKKKQAAATSSSSRNKYVYPTWCRPAENVKFN